jgi:hypothetical protein
VIQVLELGRADEVRELGGTDLVSRAGGAIIACPSLLQQSEPVRDWQFTVSSFRDVTICHDNGAGSNVI